MKKFEDLLMSCIDEEITGTTIERLIKVKEIFESEMLNNENRHNRSTDFIRKRLQDWLQGLCNTVSIPFEYNEIIAWYEKELGRKAKNDTECQKWLDKYWPQCALTLYEMLYK